MQNTRSTTRREVVPGAGQEDRAQGRAQGQGQGGSAADAARDRRGEEDRVALLIPTWWQRDPDLLAAELRSLRGAGFRLRRHGRIAHTSLAVDLQRGGRRYRVVYPSGFPSTDPVAFRRSTMPTASTDERVGGQGGRPGGTGVLALEQLIHGTRDSLDFRVSRFGVLLAGPWVRIEDGEGGLLRASTSGRGGAVLVSEVTGTGRAEEIKEATRSLTEAFDGSALNGWWVRGDELSWDEGPAGIARQVEQAIARFHRIPDKHIWSEPRPLLGYASRSVIPGYTAWLFISRGPEGGRALGAVQYVTPESFRIRAPYAQALADKRVSIIGCGSLGWPIAIGLARAGVRNFALYDADRLFPGNLARLGAGLGQTGDHKVAALRDELHQVASDMRVHVVPSFIGEIIDAHGLLEHRPDLIIDAAADEATPNHTNAAALALRIPAIYAWMTRGVRSARIFRMVPGRTACYACVAFARPRSLVDEPRSDSHEFDLIGANFNIDPIAAATVRLAVRTLAGDPPSADNPDHLVLRVGGPVPLPEVLQFDRDPRCRWCGNGTPL